jgi:hypothetical protein
LSLERGPFPGHAAVMRIPLAYLHFLLFFVAFVPAGPVLAATGDTSIGVNNSVAVVGKVLDKLKRPAPQIVSQIIASAHGHAFTSREAQISEMIDYMIHSPGNKELLAKVGSPQFDRNVMSVVMDWLADQESRSFQATELTPLEVQEAQKLVMSGINRPEVVGDWNALEVTAGEIHSFVQRQLNARKFVNFKSRASFLPITDEEAEAYYKANHGKFGDEPFAKFKDDIKLLLSKKRQDERMDEWFSILQKKYKVRFFPTVKSS